MDDFTRIRRLFPHTRKSVYFNVASSGPLPTPAYEILDANYQRARMATLGNQEEVFVALEEIRREGARIFGCAAREVGFGFNTTFGLNLAAYGLPFRSGDEVLLTDVEFPANVYPWVELRNRGVRVTHIRTQGGILDPGQLVRAITPRTRAVSLSFVQYFNGYKIDPVAVGRVCREHGLFFVLDAMQGAGAEPMRVKKWGVDIASAGAQKWLLSNQGSGIFFVSDEVRKRLSPPWRSWLGVDWKCDWTDLSDFDRPFDTTARQFEMGTYPSQHVLSLAWSLRFINELGIRKIQRHNHALIDRLAAYLKTEPAYRIVSSMAAKHRSSILAFTTRSGEIRPLHRMLLKQGIVTAMREGAIRVSVHLYNNVRDIDRLVTALKRAAKAAA